jgi:DNA-binding transcriptional regulator LsrR (DeoR family)
VTEAVSLEQLRDAARQNEDAHDELIRLVRLANGNGIPKTKIAEVIGMSRETVRRYCIGGRR